MASFEIQRLREGYSGTYYHSPENKSEYTPNTCVVLTKIIFEPSDRVVCIPATAVLDGVEEKVTHIGYYGGFEEAHEHFADWHHPSKGGEYVPDRYLLRPFTFKIPSHVEKIVIPESVTDISYCAFPESKGVILEVHPDNPRYTVEDNKIAYKR